MKASEILSQFKGKRILVLGDVMLDAYMTGKVSRISPEAPVPIVNLEHEDERLGGAANVAFNLASLGAVPVLCSIIGNDPNGLKLIELMRQEGMSDVGIICSDSRVTTVKTRIIANQQQLLRIDAEQTADLSSEEEDLLLKQLNSLLDDCDALIFEDYNKGVLTEKVIHEVIRLCHQKNIITTVDPKKKNFFAYQGVTLFKPNLKELREGLNKAASHPGNDDFHTAIAALKAKLKHDITFITLSEHGVFISDDNEQHHIPAHVRNIADVSGAGDTVISVASLCLCIGLPIETVAAISNLAGGIVCEKSGVVSITPHELETEMERLLIN